MNEEQDPITEFTDAIKSRLWSVIGTLALFAFVMGLIAPVFGTCIKNALLKAYVMDPNYESIANEKMKTIYPILWIWAVICWVFLIWTNIHGYCN